MPVRNSRFREKGTSKDSSGGGHFLKDFNRRGKPSKSQRGGKRPTNPEETSVNFGRTGQRSRRENCFHETKGGMNLRHRDRGKFITGLFFEKIFTV